MGEPWFHEAQLDGRLLDALAEVLFVEREPQLAVLQDVVLTGVVVPALLRVVPGHLPCRPAPRPAASVCYVRVLLRREGLTGGLHSSSLSDRLRHNIFSGRRALDLKCG